MLQSFTNTEIQGISWSTIVFNKVLWQFPGAGKRIYAKMEVNLVGVAADAWPFSPGRIRGRVETRSEHGKYT